MLYQRSSDGMQNAVISLGGYYRAPEWEATAKIGLHSVSLGYHQKFKDYFTLVCDLEGSLMQVSDRVIRVQSSVLVQFSNVPKMFKVMAVFNHQSHKFASFIA